MNPFKRNDIVLFLGEQFTVRTIEGLDVFIENASSRHRVDYRTVKAV
jgi:hypothetical protein